MAEFFPGHVLIVRTAEQPEIRGCALPALRDRLHVVELEISSRLASMA